MIFLNFDYLRPTTIEEACEAYAFMQKNGHNPLYYAGGTEVVSYCRTNRLQPGAVIDLKHIPECLELTTTEEDVVLGAALTLNTIIEANLYPLLSDTAGAIADHSLRNRVTLGGNMAGHLPYRETLLPLLVADASVQLAGPQGQRSVALEMLFDKHLQLENGEFIVQVHIPKSMTIAPSLYRRRTRQTRVAYPIASAAFLKHDGQIRMAIGGAYGAPVRNIEAEKRLNDHNASHLEHLPAILDAISLKLMDDQRASAVYRQMLLTQILQEALEILGK